MPIGVQTGKKILGRFRCRSRMGAVGRDEAAPRGGSAWPALHRAKLSLSRPMRSSGGSCPRLWLSRWQHGVRRARAPEQTQFFCGLPLDSAKMCVFCVCIFLYLLHLYNLHFLRSICIFLRGTFRGSMPAPLLLGLSCLPGAKFPGGEG